MRIREHMSFILFFASFAVIFVSPFALYAVFCFSDVGEGALAKEKIKCFLGVSRFGAWFDILRLYLQKTFVFSEK